MAWPTIVETSDTLAAASSLREHELLRVTFSGAEGRRQLARELTSPFANLLAGLGMVRDDPSTSPSLRLI